MPEFLIRPVKAEDAQAIGEIYAYYVKETVITYEETVPDTDEIQQRINDILYHDMPYLVAEYGGEVIGYAYIGVFRSRKAYRYVGEHSIYLSPHHQGLGLGSKLMQALLDAAEPTGLRQLFAVIGDRDNTASIKLHEKFGFKHVGIMEASGYKFNRWVDTLIMQRPVGPGRNTLPDKIGLKLT